MLHAAGRRIWLWSRDHGLGGAAGSTLVCALVWGHHYLVAHAGDSRCYYVNRRGASPLTLDHTEAARLVREGALAPGKRSRSPLNHRLTNALGLADRPRRRPRARRPTSWAPSTRTAPLLVCSDGLHTMVTETDIHAVLHETRGVEEACRRLVALALDRGSSDNVSVAAVEVGRLRRSA